MSNLPSLFTSPDAALNPIAFRATPDLLQPILEKYLLSDSRYEHVGITVVVEIDQKRPTSGSQPRYARFVRSITESAFSIV